MNSKIRAAFLILGSLAIGQVIWWAYLLISQQNLIHQLSPNAGSKNFNTMILFEGSFFVFFWGLSLFWLYRSYMSHIDLKNLKENFLSAISHELKTPIANAQLCFETLERPQIDEVKKMNYIKKGRKSLNQLNELVNNLLKLTTTSHFNEKPIKMNLKSIVNEALEKIDFDKSKVKLTIDIDTSIYIHTNPTALEFIIKNLFDNSLKYSNPNQLRIEISAISNNRDTSLIIKDNGIGMTDEDLKNIFNPFWRSHSALKEAKPGAGIGLAICKQLALSNKMRIEAESSGLNQGSTFKILWSNSI